MDSVYVDTDVILDLLLDRVPYSNPAAQLFSLADQKQIRLCSSGLVVSNCYYVLRKWASHEEVLEKLRVIISLLDLVPVNEDVIHDALHARFNDFEDAIQNATAARSGLSVLLTRNLKDFRHSQLSIMTPEEYIKSIG